MDFIKALYQKYRKLIQRRVIQQDMNMQNPRTNTITNCGDGNYSMVPLNNQTFKQINIYISSASTSEDKVLLDELEKQLSMLKRQPKLSFWQKRHILPGMHREQQILTYLKQAHLILFLISPDFLASDQCYEEMKVAMVRMNAKEVSVIPLLMRHSANWQETPIGMLEPLPSDRKPVSDRVDRERTMRDIAECIQYAVEQIRQDLPDKNT